MELSINDDLDDSCLNFVNYRCDDRNDFVKKHYKRWLCNADFYIGGVYNFTDSKYVYTLNFGEMVFKNKKYVDVYIDKIGLTYRRKKM